MSLILLFPDLGTPVVEGQVYMLFQNNRIEFFEANTLVFTMEA